MRAQLWKAAQKFEHGTSSSIDGSVVSGILQKLSGLEALVIDLHWITFGQWQQNEFEEKDTVVDVECGTGQVGSALCPSGFGSGVQFAPAQFLGAPANTVSEAHCMGIRLYPV